jgi:hypothetical protein
MTSQLRQKENKMSFFSKFRNSITLPKTSGKGIKVDPDDPTFGWRDIIGLVLPDPGNPSTAPSLEDFRGGVYNYQYDSNDRLNCVYHVPHDYVPGTDLFIHLHWGHNRPPADIAGNFVVALAATYAHRETAAPFSIFPAPITPSISVTGLTNANYPQHCHVVSEIQISADGGGVNLFDSADIEVDGLINVTFTYVGTMNTNPFIFTGDIHYQSNNMATKQKASPYWT